MVNSIFCNLSVTSLNTVVPVIVLKFPSESVVKTPNDSVDFRVDMTIIKINKINKLIN